MEMVLKCIVCLAVILVQASLLPMLALGADADLVQDFCVADGTSKSTVNGLVCKGAADVKVMDFLFPKALVHFQLNVGTGPAVTTAALRSQNSGVQQRGRALFGSNPPESDAVLEKASSAPFSTSATTSRLE